ncbi:hypothetical protein BDZ45DRAFT_810680 [Acephala macrosclerotiorum]|nr:hypothetical protein BDZ45DRAFT_810680 [Acephala macrosclerotiorum]
MAIFGGYLVVPEIDLKIRYQDQHHAVLAQSERSHAINRHRTVLEGHSVIRRTQQRLIDQNETLANLMSSFKDQRFDSRAKRCVPAHINCQKESEERLYQAIRAILEQVRFAFEIPPQIHLQKPVTFTDALGRVAPIHLDFINSAEALLAVLKVRFKHVGLSKVERKEFALLEEHSDRTLDLGRPWESVMFPGQHVNMTVKGDCRKRILREIVQKKARNT